MPALCSMFFPRYLTQESAKKVESFEISGFDPSRATQIGAMIGQLKIDRRTTNSAQF